jgi:hypothetical protein
MYRLHVNLPQGQVLPTLYPGLCLSPILQIGKVGEVGMGNTKGDRDSQVSTRPVA